jgi:hypothetical protein
MSGRNLCLFSTMYTTVQRLHPASYHQGFECGNNLTQHPWWPIGTAYMQLAASLSVCVLSASVPHYSHLQCFVPWILQSEAVHALNELSTAPRMSRDISTNLDFGTRWRWRSASRHRDYSERRDNRLEIRSQTERPHDCSSPQSIRYEAWARLPNMR